MPQSRNLAPVPLTTPWGADVDPACPLPEYPRPQLERPLWMNLNGLWEYAIVPRQVAQPEYQGRILVPYCPESALSGVGRRVSPQEHLWYRRTFSPPADWQGNRILLHFGAVDWQTEIWVNGQAVGSHTGGYLPFTLDITDALFWDRENTLTLRVFDPTDTHWQQKGKQRRKSGGIFYTPVTGIWQTVWLEPVPDCYIRQLTATPDIDAGTVTFCLTVSGEESTFQVQIFQADSQPAARGQGTSCVTLALPQAHLWSPEDPYLYQAQVTLLHQGQPVDQVKTYFGMRKFSILPDRQGRPRLALNNRPYFQYGLLDQGYWPEGIYTPPTDEALRFDVEQAKELGFNMLRKHTKVEPARWYYWCDRLGIIVWQDMICGGKCQTSLWNMLAYGSGRIRKDTTPALYRMHRRSQPEAREDFRQELEEMIRTLINVPSIGVWVPFNESWGQFDAARIAGQVKSLDPGRIVDHASGWLDQGAGDITSRHIYFRKLGKADFSSGRPYVVSECGGFAHQAAGHLWTKKLFGYALCPTSQALLEKYRRFVEQEVLPLRQQGCSAVIYTQLSDVEQEVNGLFTYDRKVLKVEKQALQALHARLMAMPDR